MRAPMCTSGPSQTINTLVEAWRAEAEHYARDGALVRGDLLLLRVADEMERALGQAALEALVVKDAAAEARVSPGTIRRWLREERLPNVGTKGRPRVRRGDLQRKPDMRKEPA
ncbi:MAG: helix-turn-helix domain-containing protein [Gemmatimonadetes bacterium]|nr:helix-turn-helix domain-containing protein [Gemmatimonadota bacterium]